MLHKKPRVQTYVYKKAEMLTYPPFQLLYKHNVLVCTDLNCASQDSEIACLNKQMHFECIC